MNKIIFNDYDGTLDTSENDIEKNICDKISTTKEGFYYGKKIKRIRRNSQNKSE